MLVLYETPAGYSLFKVPDKKYSKLDAEDVHDKLFADSAKATKNLELVSFQPFQDTADAVSAITACQEGAVGPSLNHFLSKKLKKLVKNASDSSSLAVADKALATSLKHDNLLSDSIKVVHDDKTAEVFRAIRCHMDDLLGSSDSSVTADDLRKMQLGLSHSLGRYKLKFSADKVDTMVIQAVGLLDELDKEINTYAMRVKEWYGWHFPELQALASDNATYAKIVLATGHRHTIKDTDLTGIYNEDEESSSVEIASIKQAAEISMGTDITDMDVLNIQSLAEQVLSMTEYRAQLFEYLKNRMHAIAPNLTVLTGELVGARLISHAGSLLNLAKQPASTVQILGAEKALFRALKTKHDTPKYGLIYHASLIGQAAPKNKGKISRVLAAKCSLAIRVDALSDETTGDAIDTTVGYEGRAKVEARLRQLEGGGNGSALPAANNGSSNGAQKTASYHPVAAKTGAATVAYNTASDMQLDGAADKDGDDDSDDDSSAAKAKKKKEKKAKKEKKRKSMETNDDSDEKEEPSAKKKKKKRSLDNDDDDTKKSAKKAKKAKKEKRKSSD